MVSSCPLISKSFCPLTFSLKIIPRAPITLDSPVTFTFHSFFNSLARFSLSFSFIRWSAGTAKSTVWQFLFYFCWQSLGLVVWPILWDPFVSQNRRKVGESHSPVKIFGLCIYQLFVWSNCNFLQNSQGNPIYYPDLSSLIFFFLR